jgi:hypothetical protein
MSQSGETERESKFQNLEGNTPMKVKTENRQSVSETVCLIPAMSGPTHGKLAASYLSSPTTPFLRLRQL